MKKSLYRALLKSFYEIVRRSNHLFFVFSFVTPRNQEASSASVTLATLAMVSTVPMLTSVQIIHATQMPPAIIVPAVSLVHVTQATQVME